MKIIGIIPSRYHSTRFPGKALALLDGRPLLCHVCQAALQSRCLDEILVATDSVEIQRVCQACGFTAVMTSSEHRTPTARVKEVSDSYSADLYVMIGGDEPLLSPDDIRTVVEQASRRFQSQDVPAVINASGIMTDPAEVLDPSNIKVVCNEDGEGLYASRSPIPYPKGTLDCRYRKFVSIGVYTKEALDFFVSTPPGLLERTEEFDLLRFLEHRRRVFFVDIKGRTLSVDTPADLVRVESLITSCGSQ